MSQPAVDPVERASLLSFPCAFPIKVMGANVPGFDAAMIDVVMRFDPGFDPATIERRSSSAGAYLGLTLTINATSQEQLDALYRALTAHPMVRVAL